MSNEKQCRYCKYFSVKKTFFSGKKITCSKKNCTVKEFNVCSDYVRDGNRVLDCAGFRHHTYGSKDSCDRCVHHDYIKKGTDIVHTCKKNHVSFWSGFSPMDYICDNYIDGGLDALTTSLAALIDSNKK